MTAGHGIAHSERSPDEERPAGPSLHGIQTWVALPAAHERTEPDFSHHPKRSIPLITLPGVYMHLIAGTAFGRTAPTPTYSPMFYLAVEMEAGAAFELPLEHEERAVYVVSGDVEVAGTPVPVRHLAVVPSSDARAHLRAIGRRASCSSAATRSTATDTSGGTSSRARAQLMDEAAERWKNGGFAPVPGETEFIPLPERRDDRTTFVP